MTTQITKVYAVLISTDGGNRYRPVTGWDTPFSTRADAEACARRANDRSGWDAYVVEMTLEEAKKNGWA